VAAGLNQESTEGAMHTSVAVQRLSLRLHHVGHAVREIESMAPLFIRRFGYEVRTPVIHDPLQTAFVQFLKLAGEASFLELVAPDGPGSKLTNAVKRGGGLNHLCYTSGSLEQAILDLEETGMKLISDPTPGVAFAGRRLCWLLGEDALPIELVERRDEHDLCLPGLEAAN
jgi:methylmalonyl-CoA/ethylmalonyl-CoA epimerase